MTAKPDRRPATRSDLTIGARCYKGKGAVEYVVINRSDDKNDKYGHEWYAVAQATSKAAAKVLATGQPQNGGLCCLREFTVAR